MDACVLQSARSSLLCVLCVLLLRVATIAAESGFSPLTINRLVQSESVEPLYLWAHCL